MRLDPVTRRRTMSLKTKNFVFDFDCTLTAKHLFHVIRSGDVYLSDLKEEYKHHDGQTTWDRASKSILAQLLVDDAKIESSEWTDEDDDRTSSAKYVGKYLSDASSFLLYIFGGEERLKHLRKFLSALHGDGFRLHVSTKGLVSEVVTVLRAVDLINFFYDIEGYDDSYQGKTVYRVGYGYRGVAYSFDGKEIAGTVFYGRFDDLSHSGNPLFFKSKPDFILSLFGKGTSQHGVPSVDVAESVYYVDDDKEYYSELSRYPEIHCIDIGEKEQFYNTGKPGLGAEKMQAILKQLQI